MNLINKKIGVVGAGTMGNGIAHTFSIFGYSTLLLDIDEPLVKSGFKNIKNNMIRQVKKGVISESQMQSALSCIQTSTDYGSIEEYDLIIEAATENEEIKLNIFSKLDSVCKPEAILASNTSSISIDKISSATNRQDRVIGMHFMNPVPIMKLVEVVNGDRTSDETTQIVLDIARSIDKEPVACNDSPGFISNRILMPMINEAIFCLYEEVGTPDAIDTIMKLGMAHPMGPLALADLIGLDVCLNILNVLYSDFQDKKYAPCPLLIEKVNLGSLGRKTGNGFYNYKT
jgi:3-hydroxybutyryl-CoA dehydrogenase